MNTIKDVAKEAGVSVASVSRAINDPSSVAPKTLESINVAIQRLRYTPNKIARSLKAQTSQSVAVMVPDITNPFQVKVIRGAESILAPAGYTLFIMDSEENPEKEARALGDLLDRQIDGLVYIPVLTNRTLPTILARNILPVVFVDRSLDDRHDCVRGNNFSGVSQLVTYLLSLGKTSIALIGGPEQSLVGHERNEAFRTLRRQYQLDDNPALILTGDFTIDSGYRAARNLVESGVLMDGAVVANNLMGIGALQAFRDLGVRIPQDLVLAVFDEVGELVDPPVTHVRQQAHEMGAQASRFLLERIAGNEGSPRTVLFDPTLFVASIPNQSGPNRPRDRRKIDF